MITASLPVLGEVEFTDSADGVWDFEAQSPVGAISIDFNLEGKPLSPPLLDKAARLLGDLAALDGAARAAIRDDHAGGEGARSYEFLDYHVEELAPDQLDECFGTHAAESIGIEQLLAAVRLERLGFYLDNEEEFVIMDYKLAQDVSDQILVVYVNAVGEIQSVQMES